MTDPAGGCESVSVAVAAPSFGAARGLAVAAGFEVSGRRPKERLDSGFDVTAVIAQPGVVFWRPRNDPWQAV